MIRVAFAAGFALALALGGVSTARAGLLDFLFGWRDRTDIPRPVAVHPDITIEKRAAPGREARRPQPKRKGDAPAKAVPAPALSPREQLARTIDPVKNPRWWLEDRTLRKGDILVLNDRVVVFAGGAIGAPKSYVSLSRARLLTRKERERVAAMTGRRAGPVMAAEGAPTLRIVRRVKSADGRGRSPGRG